MKGREKSIQKRRPRGQPARGKVDRGGDCSLKIHLQRRRAWVEQPKDSQSTGTNEGNMGRTSGHNLGIIRRL